MATRAPQDAGRDDKIEDIAGQDLAGYHGLPDGTGRDKINFSFDPPSVYDAGLSQFCYDFSSPEISISSKMFEYSN